MADQPRWSFFSGCGGCTVDRGPCDPPPGSCRDKGPCGPDGWGGTELQEDPGRSPSETFELVDDQNMRIRQVFDLIDCNGDERLSKSEILDAILRYPSLRSVFCIDPDDAAPERRRQEVVRDSAAAAVPRGPFLLSDADGESLSWEEFRNHCNGMPHDALQGITLLPPKSLTEAEIGKLRIIFGIVDRNKDGVLSKRELLMALKRHPAVRALFDLSEEESRKVQQDFEDQGRLGAVQGDWDALDLDKDTKLTWAEFLHHFMGHPQKVLAGVALLAPRCSATFSPSLVWQEVPEGAICPPGLEYKMDLSTGKTQARLLPKAGRDPDA